MRSIRGTWHQNQCLTPKRIWSQALSLSNRRHRAWEWSDHTPSYAPLAADGGSRMKKPQDRRMPMPQGMDGLQTRVGLGHLLLVTLENPIDRSLGRHGR